MGLEAPSPASLARIFRQEGVARAEPSKRPRAAWRRFVYPAPNACWQLDATEYVLAGGRKAVIFQLQDDHSRLAVASLVAPGETSQAAIDVFDKGAAARGVPQRPRGRQRRGPGPQPAPSHRPPGGARALPGRRTPRRQTLQAHHPGQERALRPDPAPPPGPAAPGRLHRRAPGAGRPLRPHLQHPAPPPGPARAHHPAAGPGRHRGGPGTPTGPRHRPHHPRRRTRARRARRAPTAAPAQAHRPQRRARSRPSPATGADHIGGIAFLVRRALAGHRTTAIWDATTITFADVHGEVLIQYNWPPEGVTRVSHHPPDPTNQRGGRGRRRPQPSPKS